MVVTGGFLLLEPDFGAFVVIVAIAFGILFLGGLDWRLFLGLALLLPIALAGILVAAPYRLQRLTAFLDPWSDPLGKGYQLSHSLIAFGRGEWFGVGLGASVEKLLFLPEAHTDFLLAVIAEELGLAGVALVIALFMWLLFRTYAIGRQAARLSRPFAALVAQGVGVWIGVQAFINIGVNMGVLPTKGLTLPLLSFGGRARGQLHRARHRVAIVESPVVARLHRMNMSAAGQPQRARRLAAFGGSAAASAASVGVHWSRS
jgi:cell division protein FtsW